MSTRQPIRSMTGYASKRRTTARGELSISLRGVNHRGLDLHFHLGGDLEPFEPALRKRIAASVRRGHVDVRAQLQPVAGEGAAVWNRPLMEAWLAAFRGAAAEYGLTGEPDLNAAFRTPGMFGAASTEEEDPKLEETLLSLMDEVLEEYNAHRDREGMETAAVLRGYGENIQAAAGEMARIRQGIVPILQARLEERLAELLKGVPLDPARLVQEAAVLADRSDIGEEITRLELHSAKLCEMLDSGGEIGKKLDFLLQEMQRETNTILSKSNGTGEPGRRVMELGLAVKSEVERVREQALNLE